MAATRQKDVTEVARCFTGWTIEKPRQYPNFKFDDKLHDPDGENGVGKKDSRRRDERWRAGESTCWRIIQARQDLFPRNWRAGLFRTRPPPALVSRMAETFQSSERRHPRRFEDHDWSPEFWSRESYRAKIKTPLNWWFPRCARWARMWITPMPLVAVGRTNRRATLSVPAADGIFGQSGYLGEHRALLNRMNYSLALAGNKMRGARTDVASLLGVETVG